MRKRIIYEPTFSDAALLILETLDKAFIESFWPHPYYHAFCDHDKKRSFRGAIDRLQRRGLIMGDRQKNGRVVFALSSEGEKLARRLSLKLAMAKNKRWDGKWRLFIFDILEKTRGKRDFLRKELINFGFYPLQKSVFVYPHRLPPEFFDLWDDFDFQEQLIVIEGASIRNDGYIRRFFGLD